MGIGDSLAITKSSRILPLAMLPERSFSEVLRQKLKWSGTNV
jgi:NAD+ kinase